MVKCPHCKENIAAERLPHQRKYRNEFGLDVFECPECHQNLKFEPSEYLVIRERIAQGELPEGIAIEGVKVDELLPSEKMAVNYERKPSAPWRGPAKLVFAIVLLFLAYLIFG